MTKVVFLGAGASPGVPSVSQGWGACNPNNPKNRRRRTSTWYEIDGVKILIDTSPDLRCQMLDNNIRAMDGVCFTHAHFDHISGIDELREINRISCSPLDVFAPKEVMDEIVRRYGYMLIKKDGPEFYLSKGGLVPHYVKPNRKFVIKGVEIVPIKLLGHNKPSFGYIVNGEIVHLADFKKLTGSALKKIAEIRPKLLVMPLTVPTTHKYHLGIEEALGLIEIIKPEKVVFNHMASECDYDYVNENTPDFVEPAYDNLKLEW